MLELKVVHIWPLARKSAQGWYGPGLASARADGCTTRPRSTASALDWVIFSEFPCHIDIASENTSLGFRVQSLTGGESHYSILSR